MKLTSKKVFSTDAVSALMLGMAGAANVMAGAEYAGTAYESNVAQTNKELGDTVGKLHMIVLNAAALEQGQVKVLRKGTADGNQKSSISFRQYYSPGGKHIANATGDNLFLIIANILQVLEMTQSMPCCAVLM